MDLAVVSRRQLFLGFLLLGAVCGFFLGRLPAAFAAEPSSAKSADTVQRNTLIVLVDSLDAAQPALKGAWLAARTSNMDVSWMPLYPQPLETDSAYTEPHAQILLETSDISALANVAPVNAARVSFDEVFMLDEAAVAALSSLAGSPLAGLAETWDQPQAGLQEQVGLIQALCATSWQGEAGLDAVVALIPGHIRASLTPFDLIAGWDAWTTAGNPLACTHPWAN
jgi:hypothetical protein